MIRWQFILASLLFIIAAFLAAVKLASPGTTSDEVLSGQRVKDFGIVDVSDFGTELSHEFILRNTTDRSLEIMGLTTSCGCVAATPDQSVLAAGDDMVVEAKLRLSRSGTVSEVVHLDLGPDGVILLRLIANGRRARELRIDRSVVEISHREPSVVSVFFLSHESDSIPDAPMIESSPKIDADFLGWELVHKRDPSIDGPARMHAIIQIGPAGPDWPEAGRVELSMSNGLTASFRYRVVN